MKKPALEPPKLVDNVGDPEQVAKGKLSADILEQQRRDRWHVQLGTQDGRAVVWDILEECRSFHSAFGATDAETNRNIGMQDVGHFILAEIHKTRPGALIEMMIENAKEKSL